MAGKECEFEKLARLLKKKRRHSQRRARSDKRSACRDRRPTQREHDGFATINRRLDQIVISFLRRARFARSLRNLGTRNQLITGPSSNPREYHFQVAGLTLAGTGSKARRAWRRPRRRRERAFSCAAQLKGMNPEHLFSSGVVSVADLAPARTSSRPRHPAPARSGLTRCHAAAARRRNGRVRENAEHGSFGYQATQLILRLVEGRDGPGK
jgi:hypothetical protein